MSGFRRRIAQLLARYQDATRPGLRGRLQDRGVQSLAGGVVRTGMDLGQMGRVLIPVIRRIGQGQTFIGNQVDGQAVQPSLGIFHSTYTTQTLATSANGTAAMTLDSPGSIAVPESGIVVALVTLKVTQANWTLDGTFKEFCLFPTVGGTSFEAAMPHWKPYLNMDAGSYEDTFSASATVGMDVGGQAVSLTCRTITAIAGVTLKISGDVTILAASP